MHIQSQGSACGLDGGVHSNRMAKLLSVSVPKGVVYAYLGSLILLYIIVAVHTPLTLYADGDHDDALFMSLGRSLADGEWLGPFDRFTLTKGPGFPLFLAVSYWLGLSASLTFALFHCLAVTFFVIIAHRFLRSFLLSGLLFGLLLWHPTSLSVLRILRDVIYYDQLLILLAALSWTLFGAQSNRERLIYAIVSGTVLGWFWLTREEGAWILPGLALLVLGAVLHARRDGKMRELGVALLLVFGTFAVAQVGFRAINWWEYGKFVGVDFKERNFERALGAITSVRSGEIKPYIAVTAATRKLIYQVSPTFATLAKDLDGSLGRDWARLSCRIQPATCDEIGAGWFMWTLRHAAATSKHYSSPSEAAAFFGRIADEIEAACDSGKLECDPGLFPEMPAWTWSDIVERFPASYRSAWRLLLYLDPPLQTPEGSGDRGIVAKNLRFLNYPLHTPIGTQSALPSFTIVGWYYRSGAEWMTVTVKRADGAIVDALVERHDSTDLTEHFKDPMASRQIRHRRGLHEAMPTTDRRRRR